MKRIILALLVLTLVSAAAFAENTINLNKADLSWSLDGDNLTISFTADTDGWVAVGLGSSRMDGSNMFIGYSKNGEAYFEEHLGNGHSHKKVSDPRPVEYSVTESGGTTVMEFTVAKSGFNSGSSLPVIVAYGARDSFSSMHRYRDSAVIKF